MTLIITALSSEFSIQVSDRRLTRPDGRLFDDSANKAICVGCSDAVFSIAYTGLATIDNRRTDEWLTDKLASMNAGSIPLRKIATILKYRLETVLLPLRPLGFARTLTLAIAGFAPRGVFAGQLSNIEDDKAYRLAQVDDEFHFHFWFPAFDKMKKMALFAHGAESTIFQTDRKTVSKIARRGRKVDPKKSVSPLVRMIRRAASDPKHGRLVGKTCMSVILRPTGEFTCRYHPEKASPIEYGPNAVFPGVAYKSIYIARGNEARKRGCPAGC